MLPTFTPTITGDIVQRSLATVLERAALPEPTDPFKEWSFLPIADESALAMAILQRHPNVNYLTVRPSLWAGIHPGFAASVQQERSPLDQICTDVRTLNSTHHIIDGSVPFRTYLENMILLAAQQLAAPQATKSAFQTREVPEILKKAMLALHANPTPEGNPLNWSYLTNDLFNNLASWLNANISDYPAYRARLFQNIHPGFVASLEVISDPITQLFRDLDVLNKTTRLSDDTVPLKMFLTNLLNLIAIAD